MDRPILQLNGVSKKYEKGGVGFTSLQRSIQSAVARIFKKPDPNQKIGASQGPFYALNNVTLSVYPGEIVGLIGKNGAGKTTLLKLITSITTPSEGSLELHGRAAGLIEVGTGFHPELTGRENIYLSGAILGMTKRETAKKMDEIIAYSECGEFIDTPVKRYSSGMCVKLAFAVGLHLNAEIFVLDEVLSVADEAFKEKALASIKNMANNGRTVLCVSHDLELIERLSDRVFVLDKGELIFSGGVKEGLEKYKSLN